MLCISSQQSTYTVMACDSAAYIHHAPFLELDVQCIQYPVRTPVLGISTISLYSLVCLQSQDDSLIRQTVTLRGTHEYPITDVHIFKTATWPFPA